MVQYMEKQLVHYLSNQINIKFDSESELVSLF